MLDQFLRIVPTLSRFRTLVQILTLFLTVWGSTVVGYYAAEKVSTALPALSCAYDKQHGGYCVLIPLQHQMHHRIGEALVKAQQITQQVILPTAIAMGTFLIFFVVLGKAFCGWVCPLGTIQEWINRLGRRFNLPHHLLTAKAIQRVRPVKWLILLGLVFLVPILAGMGTAPHSMGNPYCDICPSRIITTLLNADTEQVALKMTDTPSMILSAIANLLTGFVIIGALALRQPFCRICPMLAMNATFRHFSLTRLVKTQNDKCEKCGICTKACPMDIPEIHHEHGLKAFNEDCTLCGRCAEFCPDDGVIKIKFGPWALFSSSREYYKNRVKAESPEGNVKPIKFVRRKEEASRES
jgi:NAD-dependent dihydropyrimidine dehydrogenase PreA subunit